jgi:hypothetical protein
MNEPCHVWPLEQLLCPQKLAELKGIKHRYHVWKDYSKKDNECIVKWNEKSREVYEREIYSKAIVAKQGVPKEVWFKLVINKFSGIFFAEKYV